MDKYDKLRRKAREERDRAISLARRRYREALDAIDIVRRMEEGEHSDGARPSGVRRGALADAVRRTLADIPGQFTVRDVSAKLQKNCPEIAGSVAKSSVSSFLRRLTQDGELLELRKGRGKRATLYQKQKDGDPPAEKGVGT